MCSCVVGRDQSDTVDCSQFGGHLEDTTTKSILEWRKGAGDAEEDGQSRELFLYYCYSIKFVVAMCMGRNSLVRAKLLEASRTRGLGLEFGKLHAAVRPWVNQASMKLLALRIFFIS